MRAGMKAALAVSILLGIGAIVGAVVVGTLTFDGTVTDDPYDTGLRWDENRKLKKELGWTVDLESRRYVVGQNRLRFRLKDSEGNPVAPDALTIEAGRLDTNQFTFAIHDCRQENELYDCPVEIPVPGRWELRLRWNNNPGGIYFVQGFDVVHADAGQ